MGPLPVGRTVTTAVALVKDCVIIPPAVAKGSALTVNDDGGTMVTSTSSPRSTTVARVPAAGLPMVQAEGRGIGSDTMQLVVPVTITDATPTESAARR